MVAVIAYIKLVDHPDGWKYSLDGAARVHFDNVVARARRGPSKGTGYADLDDFNRMVSDDG